MPRLLILPSAIADFERFLDHLVAAGADDPPARVASIIDACEVLTHSPVIGRKVKGGMRELVIGSGSRGYVALYRHDAVGDTISILAARHQREDGYPTVRTA